MLAKRWMLVPDQTDASQESPLPVEVELYVEPDGTVVFGDLAADVLPIALALDPDQSLAHVVRGLCDVLDTQQHTQGDL